MIKIKSLCLSCKRLFLLSLVGCCNCVFDPFFSFCFTFYFSNIFFITLCWYCVFLPMYLHYILYVCLFFVFFSCMFCGYCVFFLFKLNACCVFFCLGEAHFNAHQQPFLFFKVLLLTAQFEAVSSNTSLRILQMDLSQEYIVQTYIWSKRT